MFREHREKKYPPMITKGKGKGATTRKKFSLHFFATSFSTNSHWRKVIQLTWFGAIVVVVFMLARVSFKEKDVVVSIQPIVIEKNFPVQETSTANVVANNTQQAASDGGESSPTLLGIDITSQLQKNASNLSDDADENLSNTFPSIPVVQEDYSFYELLSRPTQEFILPQTPKQQQKVRYSVTSGLIRTREFAYSLRAQLLFLGFANIEVEPKPLNNHTWFRIKVRNLPSRSKTSEVRDFFADHNIQTLSIVE